MKKKIISALLFVVLSCSLFVFNSTKVSATATNTTLTTSQMVQATKSKIIEGVTGNDYYNAVTLNDEKVATYRLLVGRLDDLTNYPLTELAYQETNKVGLSAPVSNQTVGFTSGGNVSQVNNSLYKPVVEITAVKDIALTFNHQGFTSGFQLNNARAITNTYLEIDSELYLAKSNSLVNSATADKIQASTNATVTNDNKIVVAQNEYGGTYHISAGDKFYLTTDSLNNYAADLALNSSFVISTADYNASKACS